MTFSESSAPPLECDLDLGQSYDIAAEVGGADEVTHTHLTASRDQMGRCDWPQHMTHGRVTDISEK